MTGYGLGALNEAAPHAALLAPQDPKHLIAAFRMEVLVAEGGIW